MLTGGKPPPARLSPPTPAQGPKRPVFAALRPRTAGSALLSREQGVS